MPDLFTHTVNRPAKARGLWLVLFSCFTIAAGLWGETFASEERETLMVKAIRRVRPAVVNIRGEKTLTASTAQAGADAGRRVNGMGTGVVIDPRGYILTNYHVVDGVREIQVTLQDEKRYTATQVARDIETDLAVIKINAPDTIAVIPAGTSSDLMLGETVIAVGNAYGYENTVSHGIISSLHRAVQVSDAQFYDDLIQTDAPINPGNSGGPLVNIDGDTIGINVAVRAGAQGIGFAIPIDKALAVAAKMIGSSTVQKTWHGVVPGPDSPAGEHGVTIASIERKSPAATTGLEPGDIITAVGDLELKRALDFQCAILGHKAGEELTLKIERRGETITRQITLADLPGQDRPVGSPAWEMLGMELKAMPAKDFRDAFPSTRYRGGLEIVGVRPESQAAAQGLRPGDVLVGMHVWETVTMENVSYILKRSDLGSISPLKFYIMRGNETLYGFFPLSSAAKTAQRSK